MRKCSERDGKRRSLPRRVARGSRRKVLCAGACVAVRADCHTATGRRGRFAPVASTDAGARRQAANLLPSAAKPTTSAPLPTLTMPVRLMTDSNSSMLLAAQASRRVV